MKAKGCLIGLVGNYIAESTVDIKIIEKEFLALRITLFSEADFLILVKYRNLSVFLKYN